MRHLGAAFVAYSLVAGCGQQETSVATSHGGAASSSIGDTESTGGATSRGETTVHDVETESADESTGGTSDESSTTEATGARDDPPFPDACYEPDAVVDASVATSPDGPLYLEEAWIVGDECGNIPHVILYQPPSKEHGPAISLDVSVGLDPRGTGSRPVTLNWNDAEGTIELDEPLMDLQAGMPNPEVRIVGQIEIHEQGWDLSVFVDVYYCGTSDCYCPCE